MKGGWPAPREESLAWQPTRQTNAKLKSKTILKEFAEKGAINAPPQEQQCGVLSAA